MNSSLKNIFATSKRGAFIVFEGCDRSGKTTQCTQLVEYFQKENIPVKHIRFPQRSTTIGKLINDYLTGTQELSDQVIHLLFSANRWEFHDNIVKTLEEGTTIIADRYSYSGVAYSTAIKGLDVKWCKAPEQGLPKPDLVVYLDGNNCLERRPGYGEEIYETKPLQQAVAKAYEKMFDETWKIVNADAQIEEIHQKIIQLVHDNISHCINTKKIDQLW